MNAPHGAWLRQEHRPLNVSQHKDRVVQAISWDDGGSEFVFGDGSVFSFCDAMSSFTAFTPRELHEAAQQQQQRHRGRATRRAVQSAGTEELYREDKLFTAWTLSTYAEKVKCALAVYNSYSPHPRLFEDLAPRREELHEWHHRTSMRALVLSASREFFSRRRVLLPATTAAALPAASAGVLAARSGTVLAERTNSLLNEPLDARRRKNGSPLTGEHDSPASADATFIDGGTEITLWCALRQSRMTVHASRLTFAVRWPAPVVRQPSHPRHGAGSDVAAGGIHPSFVPPSRQAELCVYLEQIFPVARAPPEWAEMLRMALELDARIPADECFVAEDPCSSSSSSSLCNDTSSAACAPLGPTGAIDSDGSRLAPQPSGPAAAAEPQLRHESLPLTCDARERQRRAAVLSRFSRMRAADVPLLLANQRHIQCATCNDHVHGREAAVLWRYDADPTGRQPHAVYWPVGSAGNATGALQACEDAPQGLSSCVGGDGAVGAVLAVVREDGSALLVCPSDGAGYHVRHVRCGGLPKAYHVSADGAATLPPVIGRLHVAAGSLVRAPARQAACQACAVASIPPCGVCVGQPRLFLSDSAWELDALPPPAPAYGAGRYLPEVGDIAIQLSQRCLRSAVGSGQPDATDGPCAWDARWSRAANGDAPLDSSAADGSVVFLTTRIDGVGNFTALTNGVMRCVFDDRTILALIPSANDCDESNLLASCLRRDATRCTVRVGYCGPSHELFSYLSFALPFRRYAFARAAEHRAGGSSRPAERGHSLSTGSGEVSPIEPALPAHHRSHSGSPCESARSQGLSAPPERPQPRTSLRVTSAPLETLAERQAADELRTLMDVSGRISRVLEQNAALAARNRSLLCDE